MKPSAILVRGVNWLGDAVMTTPALLRLREAYPEARIDLFCDAKLADLWDRHPAVDSVITFEKGEGLWSAARKLRGQNYQVGLILPNSPRSALEFWLARIPRRIGYATRWRRWLLTDRIPLRRELNQMRKRSLAEIRRVISVPFQASERRYGLADHQIFHYLHLTSCLGASAEALTPRLEIIDDEVKQFRDRFQIPSASDRPLFGLNPGAEYGPAKRWPAERFAAAAIEIQKRLHCHWLVFGGKGDIEVAAKITAAIQDASNQTARGSPDREPRVLNLAGSTSLRELCAGFKACRAVLTNDTGPMHLAAAVGTQVVVPFGSTAPELTGPGLPGASLHQILRADVPCAPCFLRECPIDFRCMHRITVEHVVQAVLQVCRG